MKRGVWMLFSPNFLINEDIQIQDHILYHMQFCFDDSFVLEEKDIRFIICMFWTECLEFPIWIILSKLPFIFMSKQTCQRTGFHWHLSQPRRYFREIFFNCLKQTSLCRRQICPGDLSNADEINTTACVHACAYTSFSTLIFKGSSCISKSQGRVLNSYRKWAQMHATKA